MWEIWLQRAVLWRGVRLASLACKLAFMPKALTNPCFCGYLGLTPNLRAVISHQPRELGRTTRMLPSLYGLNFRS
jgi:hypothetical protein